MNNEEERAYLIWINLFKPANGCQSIDDLRDGMILSQIFHQIDPLAFPAQPKRSTSNDYDNLRILYSQAKNFFESEHQMECNIELEGGHYSVLNSDLVILIGFTLVAAVNCKNKAHFVAEIMNLDMDVQETLMLIIQKFVAKLTPSDHTFNAEDYVGIEEDWSGNRISADEFNELKKEKTKLEKQIDDLKYTISEFEHEKDSWMEEKKSLREKLLLLQPSHEQFHEQLHAETEYQADQLRTQVQELLNTLSQKENEIIKFRKQLNEENKKNKKNEEENESLHEEILELRKHISKYENNTGNDDAIELLTQEIESMRMELTASEEHSQRTKRLAEEYQNRSKQYEAKIIEMQKELDEKEIENTKLSESKKKLEKEFKKIQEHHLSETLAANLSSSSPAQDNGMQLIQEELARTRKQLEEVEQQYETINTSFQEQRKEKKEIQKKLDEANTIISNFQDETEKSNNSFSEQKLKEVEELKTQNKQLKRQIRDLENQGNQYNLISEKTLLMNHFYHYAKLSNPVRTTNYSQQQQQQQQRSRLTNN